MTEGETTGKGSARDGRDLAGPALEGRGLAGPEPGGQKAGGPETGPEGPAAPGEPKSLNEKAIEKLNESVVRLAERLEAMNLAQYIELTNRPFKMVWVNFLSGLARGVGMFLGAGVMGALTIAIVTAVAYYLLSFFNMIPVLGEITKVGANMVKDFVAAHKK